MGEAKRKRDAEEQRRREERERRQALRPYAYRGRRLKLMHPDKPGVHMGEFEVHIDGSVYSVGGHSPHRKVRDPHLLELVLRQIEKEQAQRAPLPAAE